MAEEPEGESSAEDGDGEQAAEDHPAEMWSNKSTRGIRAGGGPRCGWQWPSARSWYWR